jgi:hypothetical protein
MGISPSLHLELRRWRGKIIARQNRMSDWRQLLSHRRWPPPVVFLAALLVLWQLAVNRSSTHLLPGPIESVLGIDSFPFF